MSLIKRSPADAAFSDCVRERADYTCERCQTIYRTRPQGLHCAHVYSRRHKSVRHHADNAVALCYSCHNWAGGNPIEFTRWIEQHLGEARLEMLWARKESPMKFNKAMDAECAKHYREQLSMMRRRRADGETGRVEFESWI